MKTENHQRNYGFIEPIITDDQYILGAGHLPVTEIRPGGQWDAFLPAYEQQNRGRLETSNCANYGTLNCLETLHRALYGEELNWSERYVGVLTETTPEGNDPHKVIEIIRKTSGLIPESELPFTERIRTWDDYYSPKPMEAKYLSLGAAFLTRYAIWHEWVFTTGDTKTKQKLLKAALRFSPLGVSVRAWRRDSNHRYYKEDGERDNHWVMLYGYEEGEYWKIFDHYDDTYKKLAWGYDFGCAKRYALEKITPAQQQRVNLLTKLRDTLIQLLIRIAPSGLGKRFSHERNT